MSNRHAVFHVTLLSGVAPGKKTVQAEEIILGRVEGCDLVVDHKDVSRKHLSVKTMYGQVIIEDLGSSNGTFLNGTELKAKTPTVVGPNDVVSLGRTVTLQIVCEYSDVQPPPTGTRSGVRAQTSPSNVDLSSDPPPIRTPSPNPRPVVKAVPPPPMTISVSVAPPRMSDPQPQRVSSAPREETMPKLEIEKPALDFDSPLPRAIKQNERLHQEIIAARAEAKRLLSGAQKQAAQIVQEAERLAEIKTQGFYDRARKTEAEAEELYRRRTEEAHQDATKHFDEVRAESQQLIVEARERAQGLRDQAEKFAAEMQDEAHKKMNELIRAGEVQARELVIKKSKEVEDYLAKRETELITEVLTDLRGEIDAKRAQVARELENAVRDSSERLARNERETAERVAKAEKESAERVEKTEALNRELVQASLDNKLRAEQARKELDQYTGDLDERRRELARVSSELELRRNDLRDHVAELEKSRSETIELRSEVLVLRETRDKQAADNKRELADWIAAKQSEQAQLLATHQSEHARWMATYEAEQAALMTKTKSDHSEWMAKFQSEQAAVLIKAKNEHAEWMSKHQGEQAEWMAKHKGERDQWLVAQDAERRQWLAAKEKEQSSWLAENERKRAEWLAASESERAAAALKVTTARADAEREFAAWLTEAEKKRSETASFNEKQIAESSLRMVTLKKDVESFSLERARLANEVETARSESSAVLNELKSRLADERAKIEREEQDRFDQMKLETGRQMQKLEQDMMLEIQSNKVRLAREIVLVMETALSNKLPASKIVEMQDFLQDQITQVLQSPSSVSTSNTGKAQVEMGRARRRNQFRQISTGFVMGAAVAIAGVFGQMYVSGNLKPVERMVANAVSEKAADLKARKFNPPQTDEYKENYTDRVIYTRGFKELYLNSDFQIAYSKAASYHMLKTFSVGEEKTFQTVARLAALVKTLEERREKIHPDFVIKGIDQMRALEAETLKEISNDLGSRVRLEALEKFEREFIRNYK